MRVPEGAWAYYDERAGFGIRRPRAQTWECIAVGHTYQPLPELLPQLLLRFDVKGQPNMGSATRVGRVVQLKHGESAACPLQVAYASIACLLLYGDYAWASIGNAMKAKQVACGGGGGKCEQLRGSGPFCRTRPTDHSAISQTHRSQPEAP